MVCHDPDHLVVCLRQTPRRLPLSGDVGGLELGGSGSISAMPAGVAAKVRPQEGQTTKAWFFGFRSDRFEEITGINNQWFVDRLDRCLDIRSAKLEYYLRQLACECDEPADASHLMIDALSITIFLTLVRHVIGDELAETNSALEAWRVNRIRDFIEANPGGSCGIEDLARLCGVSGKHLSRVFRRAAGMSVHSFVEDIRLRHAKRLLADTDLPIKSVAHRVGYGHVSNFSSAFLRMTGLTPGKFRDSNSS